MRIYNSAISSCHSRSSGRISEESCGLLYLLLSAVLFSMMGAFLKTVSQEGIPSTELVFFRAVFQGFFVIIGMFYYRVEDTTEDSGLISSPPSYSRRTTGAGELLIKVPFGSTNYEQKIVILRGIVGGGFGFICYFYAIKSLPLGDAVTLFSIYPIYTIFMAKCFLNENITCTHVIVIIINLIGGMMIAGPSFLSLGHGHSSNGNNGDYESSAHTKYNVLGYVLAIAGGFFAASVVILIRKAGVMGIHTLQLLFSWCCFGLLSSVLFGFTLGKTVEGSWIWPRNQKSWLCILAMVVLGTAAHFLLNYAGRLSPAGLSSIVRTTDILWAYLLEVFVFQQVPNTMTIVGVLLIILSLAVIAFEKFREERIIIGGGGGGGEYESSSSNNRRLYDTVSSYEVEDDDDKLELATAVEMKQVHLDAGTRR